jgi:hypothetical protein
MKINIRTSKAWRPYWGPGPLPQGAEALGVVTVDEYKTGALIRMRTGIYRVGNAGALSSLPQRDIEVRLAAAALGAIGGAAASGSSKARGSDVASRAGKAGMVSRWGKPS